MSGAVADFRIWIARQRHEVLALAVVVLSLIAGMPSLLAARLYVSKYGMAAGISFAMAAAMGVMMIGRGRKKRVDHQRRVFFEGEPDYPNWMIFSGALSATVAAVVFFLILVDLIHCPYYRTAATFADFVASYGNVSMLELHREHHAFAEELARFQQCNDDFGVTLAAAVIWALLTLANAAVIVHGSVALREHAQRAATAAGAGGEGEEDETAGGVGGGQHSTIQSLLAY